jgi:RHS repeat-associated protein
MDRLATRKDALARQESYQYDANGNLRQFTDRKNQTATFTYDALNRRTGATYADGSSTSFTYDSAGRLAAVTDSVSGTIQFSYDNLDRLIQEVTPQGAINYDYDALGRRTSMTVSGQQPVTYQYDAASRLTQVAQGSLIVTIGYDNAGRRTSLTYPNGTSASYTYDTASRLTNILHQGQTSVIESLSYTYDAAGNRLTANRLSSAATQLPNASTASYDAANEQIQFGSATLTYDQNGNLTNDGTNTYTWDARNRLVSISGLGLSASFTYDALGRRTSKTISGQTTQFLYDGNDIVLESGASGVANYLRSLNIDEPFVRQSSASEFYHTDALGSVLTLTGQTGAVQTTYNYEAFGKATITGTSTNPFQYTGRENDGTGLYYYRTRYYTSQYHRFISEDPIRADITLYAYAGNRPLVATDPFGLYTVVIRGGFGDGPSGPSGSGSGGMQQIADQLRGAGQEVSVRGPEEAAAALADLQAHQGDPSGVHVVCHSRGCDEILWKLNINPDVKVDRMATLDCYGWSGACGVIPDNVGKNLNYWEGGLFGGGRSSRRNGGGAGITNIQRTESHWEIPPNGDVQRGVVQCIATGQCGGGGGRK